VKSALSFACVAALLLIAEAGYADEAPGLTEVLEQVRQQQAQLESQRRQIEELQRTVQALIAAQAPEGGTPSAASAPVAPVVADTPPAVAETPPVAAHPAAESSPPAVVVAPPAAGAPPATVVATSESTLTKAGTWLRDHTSFNSYATAYYANYDWQTDPQRRDAIDLERVTLEVEIEPTETTKVEVEVEVEHLGTGATMEFDRFEEFGEFETEIERGGEAADPANWAPFIVVGEGAATN